MTAPTLALTVAPTAAASVSPLLPEPVRLGLMARSSDVRQQAIARAARSDYPAWLRHVRAAAGCTRPIKLAGTTMTVENGTGRVLSRTDTVNLPDGVIYKACGNRRESVCPSCSAVYKRDAYQIMRSLLVGGNGVPETVTGHPAVFVTLTAPSFGPVHSRYVKRHTCGNRARCDCRPEPCRARRDLTTCPHGVRLVCFARHEPTDKILGTPLCLDCYDHDHQVVWNLASAELWRRTSEAIRKYLRRRARARGLPGTSVRIAFGKAVEMQRRAAVHFHAALRLDGFDPDDPDAVLPPPGLNLADLVDAVHHAARVTSFHTDPHPAKPDGWLIAWGDENRGRYADVRPINVTGTGTISDSQVAGYIAKYATKSTEVTGHLPGRLTDETIGLHADPDGTHTERLIEACWILGRPRAWRRLRKGAHMFGFAGHYLTKSRSHRVTFQLLRDRRIVFRRTVHTGPDTDERAPQDETTLVVNFLQFVGAGWHTTADALLANTSAAMAREHQQAAREALTTLAA